MRRTVGTLGAVLLGIGGVAGWVVSDRLEEHDEFCVSCHLDEDTPLHAAKRDHFGAAEVSSLAAAHRAGSAGFGCIDCHRGTGAWGRLEVKLVAARDALRYALGSFEEPTRMRHPLRDADCRRCHEGYDPARSDAFHAFAAHGTDLSHRCVECHRVHPVGRRPDLYFLDREQVLPICRSCHEEL